MAKKPRRLDKLQSDLAYLDVLIRDELRLPSLRENRLEGFAACFVVFLPMLSSDGQSVFTDAHLHRLFESFDRRFGGCMIPSARSHPPFWGLWNPTGAMGQTEKDYVTTIQIFANPIEPTNRFFSQLKQILKTAGAIEQQEILIARFDCWLV